MTLKEMKEMTVKYFENDKTAYEFFLKMRERMKSMESIGEALGEKAKNSQVYVAALEDCNTPEELFVTLFSIGATVGNALAPVMQLERELRRLGRGDLSLTDFDPTVIKKRH